MTSRCRVSREVRDDVLGDPSAKAAGRLVAAEMVKEGTARDGWQAVPPD